MLAPPKIPVTKRKLIGSILHQKRLSTVARGASQHESAARGHGFIVGNESASFRRWIGTQIVRPPKTDGLVPELDLHMEGTVSVGNGHGISDQVAGVRKSGIARSVADHCNIRIRRLFLKS